MSVTYFRNFKTSPHGTKTARWLRAEPRPDGLAEMPFASPTYKHEEENNNVAQDKPGVFGYVFNDGGQGLSVSVPGDVVPFKFSSHTVLTGLCHDEGSPDITVLQPGVYEIGYSVTMQAAKAVQAAFALQADGKTIEGSMTARLINDHETVYSNSVLTELNANAVIRLVLSSGTALSAKLTGGAAAAWMMIKKLD